MTERDYEVLEELVGAYDQTAKYGYDGVRPLDCGGSNGSDHSYRLTKLVRLGLAEHRKGLTWGQSSLRIRGSKRYRPTAKGRRIHSEWRTSRSTGKEI